MLPAAETYTVEVPGPLPLSSANLPFAGVRCQLYPNLRPVALGDTRPKRFRPRRAHAKANMTGGTGVITARSACDVAAILTLKVSL